MDRKLYTPSTHPGAATAPNPLVAWVQQSLLEIALRERPVAEPPPPDDETVPPPADEPALTPG